MADEMTYKGQRYVAAGEAAHVRKDGQPVRLIVWRSWCAQCGEAFEFRRPPSSQSTPSRRCARHKRPGIAPRAK